TKGFSRANRDLYPKHALKTSYITREHVMRNARLIQDFRDTNYRPTRRTIADGLARLEQELGAKLDIGRCHLHVPHQSSGTALFATLWYQPHAGDDIIIAYPPRKDAGLAPHRGQGSICRLTSLMAP